MMMPVSGSLPVAVSSGGSKAGRIEPGTMRGFDFEALWQAVCRVTYDYVVLVDRSGTIRFANRVGDGYTDEQVVGQSVYGFTVPESTERLRSMIAEVFATGEVRRLDTTTMTGSGDASYFAVSLGPVMVGGDTVAVVLCCENRKPLVTSEASLRHERQVLRQLLAIQERERQLVSYEIHDGLAQYLTGAMMHLEACDHAPGGGAERRNLREGLRLLRAAADEARRLISGLRPPALDELGIIEAVESLVVEARADVPKVDYSHELPSGRLPPDVETTMFRIVQESLSNVRRHAQANAVSVRLEAGDAVVRIVVRDDGVGFDPAAVPDERFGLEGIRQRASLLGGEASITSRPGQGTTVRVTLPLRRADAEP